MCALRWLRRASARASNRPATFRPGLERLELRDVPAASSLDLTFATTGIATVGFNLGDTDNDAANAVAVQRDGKVVVAGFAQTGANAFDFAVVRFNRDGTLDTTFGDLDGAGPARTGKTTIPFNLGGTNDDRARAVTILPDGRILVAGFATAATGTDFAVCRLDTNGTLDTSFDGDGKFTVDFAAGGSIDGANAIALLPDGRFVLAGSASTAASGTDLAICRINRDGGLDSSFDGDGRRTVGLNIGGTNNDVAHAVALGRGGRIVLAGTAENSADISEAALVRLTATGALDAAFASGIVLFRYSNVVGTHTARGVALQPNGKVVVVGEASNGTNSDVGVARFHSNGILDRSFSGDGRLIQPISQSGSMDDVGTAVHLQPDGKILVAGTSGVGASDDVFILRLRSNGTTDPSFNGTGFRTYDLGTDTTDAGHALALNRDGIIVAGQTSTAADGTDMAVMRVVRDSWVIVSSRQGGPGVVKIFTPTGTLLHQVVPFGAGFRGGVRVAAGDVNGDSVPDLFCAPGPGGGSIVRVIDGRTLVPIRTIRVNVAGTPGLNLAVGDVLGTGEPELIVAPDAGGPPVVFIYNAATGAFQKAIRVFAPSLTQGVRVATGNTNGTGNQELIVTLGPGAPPIVKIFNANTNAVLQRFVVGAAGAAGLFVTSGEATGDTNDDVIVSRGGRPLVDVISPANNNAVVRRFAVLPPVFTTGAHISAAQLIGGGQTEIAAAAGPGRPPLVRVLDSSGVVLDSFFAFDTSFTAGLFVCAVER